MMHRHPGVSLLLILLALGLAPIPAVALTSPGTLNNAAELTYMAAQVNANVQPWLSLYNALPSYTTYTPQSVSVPSGNLDDFLNDCRAAYTSALQWRVSGITARATKTIEILDHVASTITGGSGTNFRLRFSWHIPWCVAAAEIMRDLYGVWPGAGAFSTWLNTVIVPRLALVDWDVGGQQSGNWAGFGASARMAIGVFRNDPDLYDRGVEETQENIRRGFGNFGLAGIASNSGFYWETCRDGNTSGTLAGGDLAHTQMFFLGLTRAAETARHQGQNLYNYVDPSDTVGLQGGLNYHDEWIGYPSRSGSTQTGWPCSQALANVDTLPWEVWQAAYNQYGTSSYAGVAAHDIAVASCVYNDGCFMNLTHRYNEGTGPVADTTDPTTPGSPAAVATSSSEITVSWTASTDAVGVTGYRIDHCDTTACVPSIQLALVSGSTLSYVHTGLAASSTHSYRIRALDAAGNDSAQTATVTTTTNPATPTPPIGPAVWVSSPDGNDTNPGTQAQPYLTFRRGLNETGPGETLYARGTHDPAPGLAPGPSLPAGTSFVFTPLSGTSWDAPVTVRNWPGSTLTLAHTNSSGCFLNMNSNTKYFQMIGEPVPFGTPKRIQFNRCGIDSTVSGAGNEMSGGGEFIIEHVELSGGTTTQAIGGMFRNIRLSHIRCHDNGQTGNDHCVYAHPDNLIMEGFECYNQSGYCMQIQNTREQQGVTCPAPNYCGVNNITVRNNVIRNNGAGGVIVRGNTGAGGSRIYNNFIYNNSGSRGLLVSNPNALVANNTASGNNVGQTSISTANCQMIFTSNPNVSNNLVVNSATNRPAFCSNNVAITSTNIPANFYNNYFGNGVNPLFANAAAGDFRLLAGSPAINTGVTVAAVPTDYYGAVRPSGGAYDIGAHEFGGPVTPPPGDSQAPSTPTLLTLTLISPTQVNLDWPDSTDNVGVVGYRVYRCSHTGGGCVPSVVIASPPVSAYNDTGVVAATKYVYAVAAIDAAGNLSQLSSTAAITTSTPAPDITAPTTPTGVVAVALDATTISLTWPASTDAVGVTGYLIRRCSLPACLPTVDVDVSSTNSYTGVNLTPSTTYGFSVAARDAANNISGYSTPASYAITPAAPAAPSIILLLNGNTNNTGTAGGTPVNTGVTFTSAAGEPSEGQAGDWNATTDVIMVPTTGFLTPTNMTIALTFYPRTSFGVSRALFGHSSTTTGFANRIQLRVTETGRVGVGLGDNSMVSTDVTGASLSLGVQYRVWLRISPTGYTAQVARAGTGFIGETSGSHSGLTTLGANFAVGNNMVNNTQGFLGSMDVVNIVNREWSDAEVDADCVARVAGCTAAAPPTFDPFVMASGVQGDGLASSNNRNIRVTTTGTPDPAVCNDVSQFFLAYAGTREPITGCSLQGSTMQLTVAGIPLSGNVVLTLTYLPTGQQIFLTNSTIPDLTTGNNLQQVSWWCRRDGPDTTAWEQLPNQICRVPSPGVINLRVDLVNVGGTEAPAQPYALYCDRDVTDATDAVRIAEVSTSSPFACTSAIGICLNRVSRGVPDGTVRAPVLPNPAGVTALAAGTLQRTDVARVSPVLAPNQRTEFEFSLKVAPNVAVGTIFHCGLRPANSGAPLSVQNLAPIRVDTSRFFSE